MGYATIGHWFDMAIPMVGGTAPYAVTLVSGYLPTGLGLESDRSVQGDALLPQQSTFTVAVTDASHPAETLVVPVGIEVFSEPISPSTGRAGYPQIVTADDLLLPLTQDVGPLAVAFHNATGGGGSGAQPLQLPPQVVTAADLVVNPVLNLLNNPVTCSAWVLTYEVAYLAGLEPPLFGRPACLT